MSIELHSSTTDQLVRICVPPSISDYEAISLLRSCGELWPSKLSIADSTTVFLEIERKTAVQNASSVRDAVAQFWIDLTRKKIQKESVSHDLENLVSAVLDRSLGKR